MAILCSVRGLMLYRGVLNHHMYEHPASTLAIVCSVVIRKPRSGWQEQLQHVPCMASQLTNSLRLCLCQFGI